MRRWPYIFMWLSLFAPDAWSEESQLYMIAPEDRVIAYAYCPEESDVWVECMSHELSCVGGTLHFTLFGEEEGEPPVSSRNIVKELLSLPWGEATVSFLIEPNEKIDVAIESFEVILNAMNADWDVRLGLWEDSRSQALLDGLLRAESVKVAVAGLRFDLTPEAGSAEKLTRFATDCSASD